MNCRYLCVFGGLRILHEIPEKASDSPQQMRSKVLVLQPLSLLPLRLLLALLFFDADLDLRVVFQRTTWF